MQRVHALAVAAAACLLLALHDHGTVVLVVVVMGFSASPATTTTTTKKTTPRQEPAACDDDLDMIRKLQNRKELELRARHNEVAWNRLFVDVPERPQPIHLGTDEWFKSAAPPSLPSDFPPGCLLRLSPMGAPANEGFFDGDGMIHCITFPPTSTTSHSSGDTTTSRSGGRQPGTFSSTFVDTKGRQLERAHASGKQFLGTLGSPPRGLPLLLNILRNSITFQTFQGQKDTCNTALAQQNGRVLALMEQCPPSEICVHQDGRVATVANNCRLDNAIPYEPITGGSLSAHGRTCSHGTGERFHVSYTSQQTPYCRVDVYTDGFQLKRSIGVNVACPTMIHDCCITENHVVIFDFPLTLRTTRFLRDQFPVQYEPQYGARIGLLRRDAVDDSNIAWFECQPGVILHAVNAFETTTTTSGDGTGSNNVVVQVLRSEPSISRGFLEEYSSSFLYEYNLDITTNSVTAEGCLNPNEIVEFPVIHEMHNGKASAEHVYCTQVRSIGGNLSTHRLPEIGITLDGVIKMGLQHDRNKGKVIGQFTLPDNWYGVSEPTVVPKTDASGGEYVLLLSTFVPDGFDSWRDIPDSALKSRVLLLDGDRLGDGPVWQCDLPFHVPYGLHSAFLPWDCMKDSL